MYENLPWDKLICVTSRDLSGKPFSEQLRIVCAHHPRAIVLREKELPEEAYRKLAEEVQDICTEYEVPLILHTYVRTARSLGNPCIHLSLAGLKALKDADGCRDGYWDGYRAEYWDAHRDGYRDEHRDEYRDGCRDKYRAGYQDEHRDGHRDECNDAYKILGCSVHSVTEAREAEALGATYLFAGHVYATDCKKGVPERGLTFLKEVCDAVRIPVYGLGGIDLKEERIRAVIAQGAAGAAVMSGMMRMEGCI